ncbi:tetratricopeptide repeat protein [Magnetospirillum moscoviense]|uniref:Tetratricopeptide repeat protein n=1 Tax=Magnetospirillum moscoviense TaxID=1437059 RepID=A0A178MB76_9PROT|nr:tetratricopeptide repeat protein [Magnetospirillum moscoviense]MBF0324317.1 tetratricopeptide repeat protein [Alphaproteobacteria bacterium]OAN45397.1 hypothetical protein A6A05_04565 [Magnetospirillum moscoviense]
MPTDTSPLFESALAAWKDGRPAEARALLAELADENPDSPDVWLALGRVCLHLGDGMAAFAALSEAAILDPARPQIALALAEARWRTGDAPGALTLLAGLPPTDEVAAAAAAVLTSHDIDMPELAELMRRAADLLARRQDWTNAAAIFHRLALSRPDDPVIQSDLLAAELTASGLVFQDVAVMSPPQLVRLRRAIAAFRASCRLDPKRPALWNNIGTMLAHLESRSQGQIGAKAAAAHCLTRWLALEPDNRAARAAVADIFYSRRRMDQAAAVHFGRLIPSGPGWEEQPLEDFLERLDATLADIEHHLAAPPSAQAISAIGHALAGLGLSKEASAMFHRAHQAQPLDPGHRVALADMLVRHRLLNDAAAFYAGRPAVAYPPVVASGP